MTKGRRQQSSEDLVRSARDEAARGMSVTSPASDDNTDGLGESQLSAEEIAAFLAESTGTQRHDDERESADTTDVEGASRAESGPVVDDPSSTTLPQWAVAESTPPAASRSAYRPPIDDAADPPSSEIGSERDAWTTSSAEWEARPKRKRRQGIPIGTLRPLAFLVFLGFAAFGFISAQLDGSEAIDSLEVGSCFDAGDAEQIDRVPTVDCAELHDSELFASVTIVGFQSAFPGDDALFEWLMDECISRFDDYVGEPYETSAFWIDPYIPTQSGWSEGDRTGLCSAVVVDEDFNVVSVTGSARGSGGSA